MILFKPKCDTNTPHLPYIALLGVGLVGKAIASHILNHAPYDLKHCQSFWGQEKNLHVHKEMIDEAIKQVSPGQKLEIIWSAGKAGFYATQQEAEQELNEFKAHLDFINQAACSSDIDINFTLFSSAGGLFEGQRLIESSTAPAPQRFYGDLKLNMEKTLESYSFNLVRIVRLTSVFGYIIPNQRKGLIPTLIENGLKRRVTSINGTCDTLRDYIFVEDIASFIVQEIFSETIKTGKKIVLLTGEKTSSIGEIVHLVEQTLKRKLFLQWNLKPTNPAHISYRSQNTPGNFPKTPLSVAISKIYHNYLS